MSRQIIPEENSQKIMSSDWKTAEISVLEKRQTHVKNCPPDLKIKRYAAKENG